MSQEALEIKHILWCCCAYTDTRMTEAKCYFNNRANHADSGTTLSVICHRYCISFRGAGAIKPDHIPIVFKPEYVDLAMAIFREMDMVEHA